MKTSKSKIVRNRKPVSEAHSVIGRVYACLNKIAHTPRIVRAGYVQSTEMKFGEIGTLWKVSSSILHVRKFV